MALAMRFLTNFFKVVLSLIDRQTVNFDVLLNELHQLLLSIAWLSILLIFFPLLCEFLPLSLSLPFGISASISDDY